MDLFIPFHFKDADVLPHTVTAARRFIEPKVTRVVCMSTPPDPPIRRLLASLDIEFIDESSVIPGLPFDAMPRIIIHDNTDRTGWYYQQFLKFGARRLTKDPYYAFVDTDTSFIAPTKLIDNGKYVFQRSGQYHLPYFVTYEKLMGFPVEKQASFVADHMIFDVALVEEMLAFIEQRHPGKTWYQAILRCINTKEISSFAEPEQYGNYLSKFHPDRFTSLPYLNLTLPKDRAHEHEKNAAEARKKGFTSISYHSFVIEDIYAVLRAVHSITNFRLAEVAVDVGSPSADVALIAMRLMPQVRMFHFECDPLALKRSRRMSGARQDIQVVEKALLDRSGPVEIPDPEAPPEAPRTITVQGTTLAQWAQTAQVTGIDLLWLHSPETMLQTLQGLGELLAKVCTIVTPGVPQVAADPSSPLHQVVAFLISRGFAVYAPKSAPGVEPKYQFFLQHSALRKPSHQAAVLGKTKQGGLIVSFGDKKS